MWEITESNSGLTNKVTVPVDGIITMVRPKGVKIHAFINDKPEGIHHLHVKAGDVVHFEAVSTLDKPARVAIEYNGETKYLNVAAGAALTKKGNDMHEAVNLFTSPNSGMGGAIGGGMGAGLLGGILGGALLGNNGILGNNNRNGAPWATPSDVQTVVADNSILTTLGNIQAAIPLAEAQVQLALAGQSAAITNSVVSGNQALTAGLALTENVLLNNLNTQALANQKSFSDLGSSVAATGSANLLATERAAYAVTQAITNDGDKTRALIQSIDKTNDSRLITSLSNEVTELRGDRRLAEATGNITISNNNTAVATAQQQQAQQQFQILANLNAQLQSLNNDIQAVRQSSVVFNSGSMRESGNQTAANTRVA